MSLPAPSAAAAGLSLLSAVLAALRCRLERLVEGAVAGRGRSADGGATEPPPEPAADPPTLAHLAAGFQLGAFERELLLLAAGPDLDPAFGPLCAALQGSPAATRPTFALARAALPGASWGALAPSAPLRLWRLLETDAAAGPFAGPLRLAERVLLFLTGTPAAEPRLAGRVEWVAVSAEQASGLLTAGQRAAAERLAAGWRRAGSLDLLPLVELRSPGPEEAVAVAAAACAARGLGLCRVPLHALPTEPEDLESLRRLWEREATLAPLALLVEAWDLGPEETARRRALAWFLEHTWGLLLVAGAVAPRRGRPVLPLEVPGPGGGEQAALWRAALGERAAGLDGEIEALAGLFRLGPGEVRTACARAVEGLAGPVHDGGTPTGEALGVEALGRALRQACRAEVRRDLPGLAQRLEPAAGWADLVLPEEQMGLLRRIGAHVRHRRRVLEEWGFGAAGGGRGTGSRGVGTVALFVGPSGTGKSLAAEVLAGELALDLYRVDLAAVVSKYIGETEKNLARLFDAAEEGAALLLFDEADALFGKRSEVRDSHDRYANLEVSYLLQRLESYSGLAVLTTNLKDHLDPAFLRRIQYLVRFPFPGAGERLALWRRALPEAAPRSRLDLAALARLDLSGAHIRNVALAAAYAAAEAGRPLGMADLLAAARVEYGKLGRTMPGPGVGA